MDEQGSDHDRAPVEKKKGKGPLIGIVIAAVLVVGAGAAGAVMGLPTSILLDGKGCQLGKLAGGASWLSLLDEKARQRQEMSALIRAYIRFISGLRWRT